jgi:outer membrane lipoprotein SlyB
VTKKVVSEKRHAPTATHHETQQAQAGNLPPLPDRQTTATVASPTPPICVECGTVQNIRQVRIQPETSPLGVIAGGVIGGLLGNQVGGGNGRAVATVAGAVGGAYAGNQVEKNMHSETHSEITVRFDDGSIRTFPRQEAGRWRQGDRIRMNNGMLLPI